ncbi:MAG: class I SAM-dependent methyltransferase [Peptococcaceae bacterium]|nr:class I SAM-dependent methyltransferase [Peptococcaceae bacterium]
MNMEYFEQLWAQKEEEYESYREGDSKSWDERVHEFTGDEPDERIDLITRFLIEKQILQETSMVLDIGCGPGKFALEFARTSRKGQVVGVDISPKMLEAAENNLLAAGLDNVQFKYLDWHKVDLQALGWINKFSLVTAIMSPAISNRKSLEKMTQASRGHCLLCHFLQRDSIGEELKKRILGSQAGDKYGNKGLYCSFNLLWLANFYPQIFYLNTQRKVVRSLEETIRHYQKRLGRRVALTSAQKADIADFLKSKAQNNQVTEIIKAKIGCVYWRNNSPTNK